MIGVMKAGMGYFPLAVDYPVERIKIIMRESNAEVVITSKKQLITSLQETDNVSIVFIEEL